MQVNRIQTNAYHRLSMEENQKKASQIAIIQQQKGQISGYGAGARNAQDGKSVLNTADAAMGSINDYLLGIRDLSVKASNSALLSDDEKKAIQQQIDQYKQEIADIANNTEFNTKKLLDGNNDAMHIAAGADGSGMDIDTGNATLEALGIKDFDTTGRFSIKTIDDALKKISEDRSNIGAQSDALDYTIGYNTQTSYNLTAAMSRKEDTDVEKVVSDRDKQKILQTYRIFAQRRQQEQERQKVIMFTQ